MKGNVHSVAQKMICSSITLFRWQGVVQVQLKTSRFFAEIAIEERVTPLLNTVKLVNSAKCTRRFGETDEQLRHRLSTPHV